MVGAVGALVDGQGALVGGAGGGEVAQVLQHAAQVVDADGDGGVVGAVGALVDGQGALTGGAGSGEVAEGLKHAAQVVDVDGDVRVVGAVGALVDGQGALVGGAGGGEVGEGIEHPAQVVDVAGDGGVVGAVGALVDGQGALEGGAGGGEVAQVLQHPAQVVDQGCEVGVIRAEDLLKDGQGALVGGAGAGEVGDHAEVVAEVVPERPGLLQAGGVDGGQGGLQVGAQGVEGGGQAGLGGGVGEARQGGGEGGEGGEGLPHPLPLTLRFAQGRLRGERGEGAGILGQEGMDGGAGGGVVQGEEAQAGQEGEGLVAGGLVEAGGLLQQRAGDGAVGGAVAAHQEEAAGGVVRDLLPGAEEGGGEAEVVGGRVAQVRAPRLHRRVVKNGLQLVEVVVHGEARAGRQVAGGELQGEGEAAEVAGKDVDLDVGGTALGKAAPQKVVALLRREGVEGQRAKAQKAGPAGAAGGEEEAEGRTAQAGQPLAGGGDLFQVVEDDEARAGLAPGGEGAGDLLGLPVGPVGERHGQAAGGDLGLQGGGVAGVEPVDAVEVAAEAVGELDGELGLAGAAHAGEGLGDEGGAGRGVEEGAGEGEEGLAAAGEVGVAEEGEAGAGREGAGVGQGGRVGEGWAEWGEVGLAGDAGEEARAGGRVVEADEVDVDDLGEEALQMALADTNRDEEALLAGGVARQCGCPLGMGVEGGEVVGRQDGDGAVRLPGGGVHLEDKVGAGAKVAGLVDNGRAGLGEPVGNLGCPGAVGFVVADEKVFHRVLLLGRVWGQYTAEGETGQVGEGGAGAGEVGGLGAGYGNPADSERGVAVGADRTLTPALSLRGRGGRAGGAGQGGAGAHIAAADVTDHGAHVPAVRGRHLADLRARAGSARLPATRRERQPEGQSRERAVSSTPA